MINEEQVLEKKEENMQAIWNATKDPLLLLNLDGIVITVNEIAAKKLSKSVDELIGSSIYDIMPPNDIKFSKAQINKITHSQKCDLTEHKRKDEEIKNINSEFLFRDLYEEAPNAYFSIGKNKSIIRCNNAAEKLLGYTNEELLKMEVFDLYSDTRYGLERAKKVFKQFLDGEFIKDVELQMKNKNGNPIWVSLSVKPIFDSEGNVIESRSMILDINERKLAQEKLKNSYERLKEMEYIINNSPGIVFLWQNSEGWPVEFVSENVKQFGYTTEEFYYRKIIYTDIIYPDDIERVVAEVNLYNMEGVREFEQEYRIITKNGAVCWVEDHTWIRRNQKGEISHYQGIILDITNRKELEEKLKKSKEKYRLITENINDLIIVLNQNLECEYINEQVSMKIWGFNKSDLMGKS